MLGLEELRGTSAAAREGEKGTKMKGGEGGRGNKDPIIGISPKQVSMLDYMQATGPNTSHGDFSSIGFLIPPLLSSFLYPSPHL